MEELQKEFNPYGSLRLLGDFQLRAPDSTARYLYLGCYYEGLNTSKEALSV